MKLELSITFLIFILSSQRQITPEEEPCAGLDFYQHSCERKLEKCYSQEFILEWRDFYIERAIQFKQWMIYAKKMLDNSHANITREWPVGQMSWTRCPSIKHYLATHPTSQRKFGPILFCSQTVNLDYNFCVQKHMNILPAKKNSSWKDACKNLEQMFEKCPKILRECLTEKEYTNFIDEFLIDIRATVIAMEDVCPIAKKNTLENCPVLNRSDNRELYFHLDTMTPLRLGTDDILHSHGGHPRQTQHYHEYNYDDDETNNIYPTTETTTATTTTTSTTTTTTTRRTTTITTVTTTETTTIATSTIFLSTILTKIYQSDDRQLWEDEVQEDEIETILDLSDNADVTIVEEIGDELEILRNLSLPDSYSSFGNQSTFQSSSNPFLDCDDEDSTCKTLQIGLFMIVMGILGIILALYFDISPRKCVEKLGNSDRVIL